MRSGISFTLSSSDRLRLKALVADRNTPQKHVWRAGIVLLGANGLGTHAIMREAGVSRWSGAGGAALRRRASTSSYGIRQGWRASRRSDQRWWLVCSL